MLSIIIVLVFVIQPYGALRCYFCRGKEHCGRSFSIGSDNIHIINGTDLYDSCSIQLTPDGLTIRNVLPSKTCRSSLNQFCCNTDLCNNHRTPPLPAFTTLTCTLSDCRMKNTECNTTRESIVYRSSPTESCIRIEGDYVHKSYKLGCTPNETLFKSSNNDRSPQSLFCCNAPECNRHELPRNRVIYCYTCDSRITGLVGCKVLDPLHPHVLKAASSNPSESCATIVGLAGTDSTTGRHYSDFVIRTFINNCIDQPLGNIIYAGARFQGRIDCCSGSLCNTEFLLTNITRSKATTKKVNFMEQIMVLAFVIILGLLFIAIGITISICRCSWKKQRTSHIKSLCKDELTVPFFMPS